MSVPGGPAVAERYKTARPVDVLPEAVEVWVSAAL